MDFQESQEKQVSSQAVGNFVRVKEARDHQPLRLPSTTRTMRSLRLFNQFRSLVGHVPDVL